MIWECQREVESIGEVKKLQARVSVEAVGTRVGGGGVGGERVECCQCFEFFPSVSPPALLSRRACRLAALTPCHLCVLGHSAFERFMSSVEFRLVAARDA